jgi:hypothetical protein
MNNFNPKIPIVIKVRDDEKDFKRRLDESIKRGCKVVSQGRFAEDGHTFYWAKVKRREVL